MGLKCHNEDDGNCAYANGIDVRLVSSEGLSAHSFSDVPEFGGGVTRSWHKQPSVWCQRQAHNVTGVASKCGRLLTRLNVPKSTGGAREGNALATQDRTVTWSNMYLTTPSKILQISLWNQQ